MLRRQKDKTNWRCVGSTIPHKCVFSTIQGSINTLACIARAVLTVAARTSATTNLYLCCHRCIVPELGLGSGLGPSAHVLTLCWHCTCTSDTVLAPGRGALGGKWWEDDQQQISVSGWCYWGGSSTLSLAPLHWTLFHASSVQLLLHNNNNDRQDSGTIQKWHLHHHTHYNPPPYHLFQTSIISDRIKIKTLVLIQGKNSKKIKRHKWTPLSCSGENNCLSHFYFLQRWPGPRLVSALALMMMSCYYFVEDKSCHHLVTICCFLLIIKISFNGLIISQPHPKLWLFIACNLHDQYPICRSRRYWF